MITIITIMMMMMNSILNIKACGFLDRILSKWKKQVKKKAVLNEDESCYARIQDGQMGSGLNLQETFAKLTFMVSVFLLASAARGEWLLFIIYIFKDFIKRFWEPNNDDYDVALQSQSILQRCGLENLHLFMIMAISISFGTFWGIGFFFDRHFYRDRKNVPKEWKCQPDRWLTKENEWHEFCLGSFNMLLGSIGSGFLSCYIMNGGKNKLYTGVGEYGYLWFLVSIPALFFYNEAVSYYPHRFFHHPYLYKKVHKIHHRYGSPTLYSTTAMHPLEFLIYQTFLAIPAFTVPLHVGVFLTILLYGYYYGLMDHSGIKMDAIWPWQPSSMFHDNHHRYFHCNFGFNTLIFDRMHGTLRKKNHEYGEKNFGGRGKPVANNVLESKFYEY